MRKLYWVALLSLLLKGAWSNRPSGAADRDAAILYEITSELQMPHLEENLRYAIVQERHCLTASELHGLFPILAHPALMGCRIGTPTTTDGTSSSPLVCTGNHDTMGTATWESHGGTQVGTLSVRLGGKNMTFMQRVSAKPLGGC